MPNLSETFLKRYLSNISISSIEFDQTDSTSLYCKKGRTTREIERENLQKGEKAQGL